MSVYDVSAEAAARLAARGAAQCPTPAAVAAASDRVVTMLPNSQHVQAAYTGPDGLLRYARTPRPLGSGGEAGERGNAPNLYRKLTAEPGMQWE